MSLAVSWLCLQTLAFLEMELDGDSGSGKPAQSLDGIRLLTSHKIRSASHHLLYSLLVSLSSRFLNGLNVCVFLQQNSGFHFKTCIMY